MENIKEKINQNKKFIVVLLLTILLTSIFTIFFSTILNNKNNISTSNESEFEILESASIEINKLNSSLKKATLGSDSENNKTIKLLKDIIFDLETIKTYVSTTIITDDITRNAFPVLISSIDNTLSLYNMCLLSLTNTEISHSEYINNITELSKACTIEYSNLKSFNLNVDFESDSLLFFENLNSYLNKIVKADKHTKIKEAQGNEFIAHLKNNLNTFPSLLEDLIPAIEKIRTDGRSLDVILDDIDNKISEFNSSKAILLSTSIPEGYNSYYEDLKSFLNSYSNYINTLRVAVIYEKSVFDYEENKEYIDLNYENSSSKLQDTNLTFKALMNSLNNF